MLRGRGGELELEYSSSSVTALAICASFKALRDIFKHPNGPFKSLERYKTLSSPQRVVSSAQIALSNSRGHFRAQRPLSSARKVITNGERTLSSDWRVISSTQRALHGLLMGP